MSNTNVPRSDRTRLKWNRRFPGSSNNFDLVLTSPLELDSRRMKVLLNEVLEQTFRGLTLHSRARRELQRWFEHPETPLKSEAYVLLSNWFMSQSGNRHSSVASYCEKLWDALFQCRPIERLSSPEAGRNHIIVPAEFEAFWQRLLEAQGDLDRSIDKPSMAPNFDPPSRTGQLTEINDNSTNPLKARFDKDGLHREVEGSPRALADFLRIMSHWEHPDKRNHE